MTNFNEDSIRWSIDHLFIHHDTDIFPQAFEYQAIKENEDDVFGYYIKQDICQWNTKPSRRSLVPKQRLGFRNATQLDPLDMLAYQSLVYDISNDLELLRLPADLNIIYSNRVKIDDNFLFFDNEINYSKFQSQSNENAEKCNFVLITDIADFYPRIYFHRLENCLNPIRIKFPSHVTGILKLIKNWNQRVSYGIPIGNNPSRILAEVLIDDIDRILIAKKYNYCRFVDDYRFFCESKSEAYRILVDLASILYDSHGLTLSEHKTKILTSEEFIDKIIFPEEKKEINSLSDNFKGILNKLGIFDPYYSIEYDDLPENIQKDIDKLNLIKILEGELSKEEFDISIVKFIINRLGWLKNNEGYPLLKDHINSLSPVFNEFIKYLARIIDEFDQEERITIGNFLLDSLNNSTTCQLNYNKMLVLGLFAGSNKWGNEDKFIEIYNTSNNEWLRRSVLLAMGKSKLDYFLRTLKVHIENMPPWERRAFIYAFSCISSDERDIYYDTIKNKFDFLDQIVIKYSKSNPII